MGDQILQDALKAMNAGNETFDVTIICTTDDHQAAYWMQRLSTTVISSSSSKNEDSKYPMVLAVSEDWNNGSGAGNGLGTLYAFQKAAKLAQELHGIDLQAALTSGQVSAALYHTAGKGTRLAPLPAAENNNKPGVNLPFGLKVPGTTAYQPMTVLEAVVKQTGIYASSRKGRLSVFWGDQVFLPTAPFVYEPTHHVDIMCTLLGDTAPTAQEWTDQGLDKYGVIACIKTADGKVNAAQVEKVSHETATQMLASLGNIQQVGPSLGSFSVSAAILQALSTEFATELQDKTAKLDTDPHFWMPLTLSEADYVQLMKQKGTDEAESVQHHQRMAKMKAGFDLGDKLCLFGAVDVGKDACWWDYGQLKLYSKNSLLLLEDSISASLLKQFLGLDQEKLLNCQLDGVTVDSTSYALDCKATSGSVETSVLAAVRAKELQAKGAIVVNCAAPKIVAEEGAILYNVVSDSDLVASAGQVIVGVTEEDGTAMQLQSRMDIDGGKAWKQTLDMNTVSFEEVHKKNKNANIVEIQKKRAEHYNKVAASLGL